MKKYSVLLLIFVFAASAFAQKDDKKDEKTKEKVAVTAAISKTSTPMELAKAALAAHGGDNFKNMKSLVMKGTADVSGSPTMTFPAPFVITFSGEKYKMELNTPYMIIKQAYDGQQTYTSIPGGMTLPPLNRLGLPLLQRIDEKDFIVSALPEKSKKPGFRITAPDGYYTDFFIDEKTGQVKSYESKYDMGGREVTTAVEIDKLKLVEGIWLAERYAQRFEVGSNTMYSDFKVKEFTVNSTIADDVFTLK
jgi:hypothetical protein